ncbi:GAF domain-containing protein [Spirosomataceae bacterium TFI 002]|nr:GAF domain-containing protein [Spirosomataceae bacterium TFI 002]
MSETLHIPQTKDRAEIYESLFPQMKALLADESDQIANMANFAAVLKEAFNFFWVGFYLKKKGQLVLGPFQGPIACTRIPFSKGVCGHSFSTNSTIVVPDVEAFPGHIACSSATKSEIVTPVRDSYGEIIGVLDIDSDVINDFSNVDKVWIEKMAALIN